MKGYVSNDRIFALATCWGKSALAIVRASGIGSIGAFAPCFSAAGKLLKAPTNTLVHGTIKDVDEVVVAVYREGHGYTGEEALEITCHGSLAAVSLLLEKLASLGFRQAEPGEFTLRAFLNGRIDLTQAEAVNEIASSRTKRVQLMGLEKLAGALSRRIHQDREKLLEVMSVVEVQLDYAEDEIGGDVSFPHEAIKSVRDDLMSLAGTFSAGRLLSEGAHVVLAGAVNVGKSSLFNLLLKQDRSIVSPVPGTTRDFIESECEINGRFVRLFDTAGIRMSGEAIEAEGIKRTKALIGSADLVVYVVDSSEPEPDWKSFESEFPEVKKLMVWNKTDISSVPPPDGFVALSAETSEGIEKLAALIACSIGSGVSDESGELVISSPRQHQSLELAAKALDEALRMEQSHVSLDMIAVEIKEALDQLGFICGDVVADDILDRIFSGFCVGK